MSVSAALKRGVKKCFDRLGYSLIPSDVYAKTMISPAGERFEGLMTYYLTVVRPDAFFVQFGAYDGDDDFGTLIAKHQLGGILVEPLPDKFQLLRQRYADHPRVKLENVAVAHDDGEIGFYRLKAGHERFCPAGNQLATTSERQIKSLNWLVPDIEQHIEMIRVPCLSLSSLLRKHAAARIDVLQIDVEGFDFEVIKMVDFAAVRPEVIRYEHTNLSEADRAACERLLHDHGYSTFVEDNNTIAMGKIG